VTKAKRRDAGRPAAREPKLAIHRLLAAGPPSPGAIDRFLAAHRFPLVEETSVTFVFFGEADAVLLQHFIYGLPTSQPFGRVGSSKLWFLVLDLPPGSRLQYKLNVERGGEGRWILDPRNEERAYDPFGANSVCHTAGAERPAWTRPDPEARHGTFEEIAVRSAAFGERRKARIYLPARYRTSRSYPLLVVHDGSDYQRFSDLDTVLDNLIHRLEVAPLVVALVDAADRLEEYPDNPRHARLLKEELLPALEQRYSLLGVPAGRGLMGASFGGSGAVGRLALPGCVGPAAASKRVIRLHRHRRPRSRPALRSGGALREPLARSARPPGREGLRFLRCVRAPDLRESVPGSTVAGRWHEGSLRRGARWA